MFARFLLIAALIATACAAPARVEDKPPTVQRVIVIGFDNYHFDDIQARMPNLYGFLQKGALSAKSHHPGLPTRTAPGFASIASGLYPDRHGAINNSFLAPQSRAGFAYWENLTKRTPPTLLSAPPWQAFNAAGFDVAAVGWQGLVLESKDEAAAYVGRSLSDAELDRYWGIAVHRKDGKAQLGVAEIPELQEEFAAGWVNGWAGPPRKHAPITLRMGARLVQAGIPVTFIYVENTHARCGATPPCQGDIPADSFNDLLEADDAAFARFFADLAKLDVTPANTLFLFTTDEGDRYLANFARAIDVADLQPVVTGSAGLFYGSSADAIAAQLFRRGGVQSLATVEAMKALRIASGGDARTPTVMAFSEPEATYTRGPCTTCYRWNHGNVHPDVTDIWLALVGPGVRAGAMTAHTDHADVVPTLRAFLGLKPIADVDGVAITPALARPPSAQTLELRELFKQLAAPHGGFGVAILRISTDGARGGTDARAAADARIRGLAAKRDALAIEMRTVLEGGPGDARALLDRGRALLAETR